ncbi:porin family protein [Flavobacteriaceae bacterium]|nr:porin family protein [Flavobacteriaceae bacterium]MDB4290008.1 porin family protein [Flavobacteriaceae bacterium]|tara:strand:+ start:1332 stop:1919 length:588 start_codon:yes stop_codon:yes gene_type:complete
MRKHFLILIAAGFFSLSNAQDSKAYLGVGLGLSVPGGNALEDLKTGLNFKFIDFGYRFSENWGVTVGLDSSGFNVDEDSVDAAVGVASLAIGPMYTVGLNETISWDIKPKYAFSIAGVVRGDDADLYDDAVWSGSGFILGNSIVFKSTKGFAFSIDLDYTFGKFKEIEFEGETYDLSTNNKLNVLTLGAGVRYNF